MNKKKIIALTLAGVTALSALALSGCGSSDSGASTGGSTSADSGEAAAGKSDSAPATESVVYTPTFMYFVSNSDAEYDAETALVEELKAEYGDKIKFDVHNIDETPEDKENFPVEGQTPVLIMLDTSNNISAMEFKCTDKDKLKTDIDNALSGTTGE